MDVLTVAAVLSLLSVSAAKPLNCENLVQPLALNKTQISGKWIYTEARTDHHQYSDVLKTLKSSMMDILLSPQNGTAIIKQKHVLNGKCRYSVRNLVLLNNTMRNLYENGSMTITVLPACPDCLVLSFTRMEPGLVVRALKLYAKTRQLSPSALEMHQKQAECLGFPQPTFKYDGKQDFCPDEEKLAVTEEGSGQPTMNFLVKVVNE